MTAVIPHHKKHAFTFRSQAEESSCRRRYFFYEELWQTPPLRKYVSIHTRILNLQFGLLTFNFDNRSYYTISKICHKQDIAYVNNPQGADFLVHLRSYVIDCYNVTIRYLIGQVP